jgi:hypothetical protein
LLPAFRAKRVSGSRHKQPQNMDDYNGGHLSKRNTKAKNDRNMTPREDRTAFGHTHWRRVTRPAHIGAVSSIVALRSTVSISNRKAQQNEPTYPCTIDRRFTGLKLRKSRVEN